MDDDVFIRELHTVLLHFAGYNTCSASDGKDALTRLATEQFDLILTDCNMAADSDRRGTATGSSARALCGVTAPAIAMHFLMKFRPTEAVLLRVTIVLVALGITALVLEWQRAHAVPESPWAQKGTMNLGNRK